MLRINAVASNFLALQENSIVHTWRQNTKRFWGIFQRTMREQNFIPVFYIIGMMEVEKGEEKVGILTGVIVLFFMKLIYYISTNIANIKRCLYLTSLSS